MYHEETDTPAVARNSNLNEELGQVCFSIYYNSTIMFQYVLAVSKVCFLPGVLTYTLDLVLLAITYM